MKTAVVVTTFNRPVCLARSLPQIVLAAKEVGAPVLVVDDGSKDEFDRFDISQIHYLRLPENRGLAGALNIGLSYWMSDPSIEAIHYFQDDVEVDPLAIAACNRVIEDFNPDDRKFVITGHDAKEHRDRGDEWAIPANRPKGMIQLRKRQSCRATHIGATVAAWKRVLPIPSRGVGLPSKTIRDAHHPERRGTGSGTDWWIVRDSPNRLPVLCVPGLVRSFAHKREDSTWDNESIAGEEPPLNRDAIQGWIDAQKR